MNMHEGLLDKALMSGIESAPNPLGSDDTDLLIHQLTGLIEWLKRKRGTNENDTGDPYNFSKQIWRGDMSPRRFGDPMGNWIAGIGQAQV